MSDQIRAELERVAQTLGGDGAAFVLERPRDQGHGDLATNLAMVLARQLKAKPRDLARQVIDAIQLPASVISRMEIAGPGSRYFSPRSSQRVRPLAGPPWVRDLR